ncbi:hypothetical protein D3C78_784500 [compost metagenome]
MQRLGKVAAMYLRLAFQVRQRPGHLEDAVQGAQGQVEAFAGGFQPGLVFASQCTILVHGLQVEEGIGATLPA